VEARRGAMHAPVEWMYGRGRGGKDVGRVKGTEHHDGKDGRPKEGVKWDGRVEEDGFAANGMTRTASVGEGARLTRKDGRKEGGGVLVGKTRINLRCWTGKTISLLKRK